MRGALLVASGFGAVAAAYLATLGITAADSTMRHVWTDVIFVALSGLVVFSLTWWNSRRIERTTIRLRCVEEQLVLADGRALAGRFAASAVHNFRNLLMVVDGTAEMLDQIPDLPEAARNHVRRLREATGHGVEIAQDQIALGAPVSPGRRERMNVEALARRCVALAKVHEHVRDCRVDVVSGGEIEADISVRLVVQAILNLVLNAAEASLRGRVEVHVLARGDDVAIQVHDDGPGVPPEVAVELFDTWITTKPAGTGLGLLSVKACARMHGGTVRLDRSPLGGAMFELALPSRSATVRPRDA